VVALLVETFSPVREKMKFGLGFLTLAFLASLGFGIFDLSCAAAAENLPAARPLALHTNEVLAFVGGADVAAAQQAGHLEALLAIAYQSVGPRFRNFGWEGATVFERQPRDVAFPSQKDQLQRAEASVIFLQYGRAEALDTNQAPADFKAGYEKVLVECLGQTPRVVLVTPPPFENAGGLLPNLAARNRDLGVFVELTRELARSRRLVLIDLFAEARTVAGPGLRLTDNGLRLTLRGHSLLAFAFLRQLGYAEVAERAGEADETGRWANPEFERVRQAVIAKNRLWFDYWRPQNWAFLGEDRTTQPSSHDHRNPAIRWFPAEMERFVPLIRQAETKITESAALVSP